MTQYLLPEYSQLVRLENILPILEFAVGTLGLSHRQALIELGYDVDHLAEEEKTDD